MGKLADAEIGVVLSRDAPEGIDVSDLGGDGSAIEEGQEAFERVAVALRERLDRAVGLIAHPARHAEIDGAALVASRKPTP